MNSMTNMLHIFNRDKRNIQRDVLVREFEQRPCHVDLAGGVGGWGEVYYIIYMYIYISTYIHIHIYIYVIRWILKILYDRHDRKYHIIWES